MEKLSNQQASDMAKMMVQSFCRECIISIPKEIEVPYDRNRRPEDEYYQFDIKANSEQEVFGLVFSIKIYIRDLKRTIDETVKLIFDSKYRTVDYSTEKDKLKWIKHTNANKIANIVALYRRYYDTNTPLQSLIRKIMDASNDEDLHLKTQK